MSRERLACCFGSIAGLAGPQDVGGAVPHRKNLKQEALRAAATGVVLDETTGKVLVKGPSVGGLRLGRNRTAVVELDAEEFVHALMYASNQGFAHQ